MQTSENSFIYSDFDFLKVCAAPQNMSFYCDALKDNISDR